MVSIAPAAAILTIANVSSDLVCLDRLQAWEAIADKVEMEIMMILVNEAVGRSCRHRDHN